MTGYQHPTQRCDGCAYWCPGDQYPVDEDAHPDERVGACHRHAPRPTLGDFEYELLKSLAILVHEAAGEEGELEWEEACLQEVCWPGTTAVDWCGEWRKDERASTSTGDTHGGAGEQLDR